MKKALSIILELCMLIGMATVTSASSGEHEHQLMKMANMNCHYEECVVCFEVFNADDHTFKDGYCTLCGHRELINPFEDVKKDAWYHDEVIKAVDTGIINGKSETEFKPDDLLTYAEAVKLAACMNQVYTNGKVTLANGEPWYKPYAEYCKDNKITKREYNYGEAATRAGYMEIFANALPEEAFEEINSIPDGSILDVKNSATYAHYVYKLYEAGIVTGVDEQRNCNPEANIKRSEVAAIISRMMDKDERVQFDMPESNGTLSNKGTVDEEGDKIATNKAKMNTKEPVDTPVISDVTINTEHESIVVEIPENSEKPEIEVGESPTLPGVQIGGNEIEVVPGGNIEVGANDLTLSILTIAKQPEGYVAEAYGGEHKLEVQVYGGKAPYTYEWQYNGYRNQKTVIKNSDYIKDANSAILVLSIEKENTLLGKLISCKITDSEGTVVTSDGVKVYGPFSMPVEQSLINSGEYTLTGKVADGILKKGEKVSVERNGKIIAVGVAKDLQMFNKSLDETVKNDNIGIVFTSEKGVRPQTGDIVIRYKDTHVIDTSDIVN